MVIIYSIIVLLLLTFSTIFYRYKSHLKKDLQKKSILHFFYGFSYFLIDFFQSLLGKTKFFNHKNLFIKDMKTAKMLHPSKDSLICAYNSKSRTISLCMAILLLLSTFGLIYTVNYKINPPKNITSLDRPTDGSDSANYSLQVSDEASTKNVNITVDKKVYETGEIVAMFDAYREEIIAAFLNGNENPANINSDLYFPDSIGSENIKLSWQPEDLSLIDLNGKLNSKNIPSEGIDTVVNLFMKLDDVEATMVISVTLYQKEPTTMSLENIINSYIDSNNDPYSKQVNLPSEIDGKKITFTSKKDNLDYVFLILGILSVIAIFLSSNSETDKALKNRKDELLSDYPKIISKLLLLLNAGLNIKNALKKITDDYKKNSLKKRFAYEELIITVNSINSGVSESGSYYDYGKRCGTMEYIKLGSMLEQNLHAGTKELKALLTAEVTAAFENRKAAVLTKSKQAETKLIFPMILILIVIMLFIMVPAFTNI